MTRPVLVETGPGPYGRLYSVGPHQGVLDEPEPQSLDAGPAPTEALLAALGACTSMTLQMYAQRKAWPLQGCRVELQMERIEGQNRIARRITLDGPLDEDQRRRLHEIADRCPVHRLITEPVAVSTTVA